MASDAAGHAFTCFLPLLLVLVIVGGADAQTTFDRSPFFDRPEVVLQAHGLEMLSARLRGIEALASSEAGEVAAEEEAGESEGGFADVIEGLEGDYRRFAAALDASSAGDSEELIAAIETVQEANERGDRDAVAAATGVAAALVDEARATLFGDVYDKDPAFTAMVMAMMLTTEKGGIGEAYEEAVEGEVGPYAVGWAGLGRVQAMWLHLEPMANETQRFEVEDMLAELGTLFPGPRPGPEVARSDPEEAEGATQRIGGFLEEVANADLFPSRDLGRLLARTRELSSQACEAYAAGNDPLGLQATSNAAFVYGEYLANTLVMLSPEAAAMASAEYDALAPGAVGEEESGEGDEPDEAEEEDAQPLRGDAALATCRELVEHLELAGGPLGG